MEKEPGALVADVGASAFMVLDNLTAAHLARALDAHMRSCRINGWAVPPSVAQLAVALAARSGQERSPDAVELPVAESGVMSLTLGDTGRLLSVSERTVRRLVSSGDLPSVSIGGCKRITRRAVEDFLASKEKRNGAVNTA